MRYKRITSNPLTYEHDALELCRHFVDQGYPIALINKAMDKVGTKSRAELLEPKTKPLDSEPIPFVSTFHPHAQNVARMLKKEWSTLTSDEELSKLMPIVPLHAQRQPPNLKKLLVKNKLPGPPPPRGNKPCGKPRCQTCRHIITDSTVRLPSGYTIRPPNHNCDSANILYCLLCAKCPEITYIGETSTRFRIRFNNHKISIRQHRTGFPVAEHFATDNHSVEDMKVCLFGGGYESAEERKLDELRAIIKSHSFINGLNKELSWLKKYTFYERG